MERYEVVKEIGSGNFGVAKLVRDKGTKELFAVNFIERGQKIDEHVEREILNHRSLRHPNIIRFKEVQGCGSIVTEEQPDAMLIPLEYFLMGYGFYRPSKTDVSPRSPLSPTCISSELYTPESMGLKLKPIKN